MANHRAPTPPGLRARAEWAATLLWHHVTDLPRAWRDGTGRERSRLIESALMLVCSLPLVIFAGWPAWSWLLPAFLTARLVADLDEVYRAIGWRDQMTRILQRERTGAPRVANVPCSKGFSHRFLWTDTGWEEAGPAQPLTEEDLATAKI